MMYGKKIGFIELMNGKGKITIEVDDTSMEKASKLKGRVCFSAESEHAEVRPDSDSLTLAEIREGIGRITDYIDSLTIAVNPDPAAETPEAEKQEGAE